MGVWGRFGPVWADFPVWPISGSRKPRNSPYSRGTEKHVFGVLQREIPGIRSNSAKNSKKQRISPYSRPILGGTPPKQGNSWVREGNSGVPGRGRRILGSGTPESGIALDLYVSRKSADFPVFSVLAEFDEFPDFVFFGISQELVNSRKYAVSRNSRILADCQNSGSGPIPDKCWNPRFGTLGRFLAGPGIGGWSNLFALTIWRMAFRKVFTTFRQVRMFYLSSRFWRSDINYLCLALKEVVEV